MKEGIEMDISEMNLQKSQSKWFINFENNTNVYVDHTDWNSIILLW